MTFDELLTQVHALLQRQGRLSYRALKARFPLDDNLLDALKDELIYAQHVAADEGGRVLVWTGVTAVPPAAGCATAQERTPLSYTPNYRLVESRRVDGKPRPVPMLHVGTADQLWQRLLAQSAPRLRVRSYPQGDGAALKVLADR